MRKCNGCCKSTRYHTGDSFNGFLGSGKSTLLSEILKHSEFQNTAVIVNEFGEVGLDGVLIEHSENQIIEMTSGCLCCTVRGDIRQTLLMLYSKQENGEIPSLIGLWWSRLV